jgi:hypothetical protein
MSKIDFSQVGSILSGVTSTLSGLGITGTSAATAATSILGSVMAASNPNKSAELQICSSILMANGNPALVQALTMKLATEQGIPQDAAALAMTLLNPGVNVPQTVLEIEQLINQGG